LVSAHSCKAIPKTTGPSIAATLGKFNQILPFSLQALPLGGLHAGMRILGPAGFKKAKSGFILHQMNPPLFIFLVELVGIEPTTS
jgi:hypothetical protein